MNQDFDRKVYYQVLACVIAVMLVIAVVAVLVADSASSSPRRDGGRTPGRCHVGDRTDRNNGLWGPSCGRHNAPRNHGASGIRGKGN